MELTREQDERQKPLLPTSTPSSSNGHSESISHPPTSKPTSGHTRPSIPALTGLRAALMLHVLIRNMRAEDGADMLGWMVDAGAVGVSTFFCLSGFILAYCYGDHRFDTWRCYWSFIGRRYARLLPIYYISQLMCVGQQVVSVRQYGWNGWTVAHWLAVATGMHDWVPWPVYEPSANPQKAGYFMLNPTLWALSAVLFFYVTMPVLMRAIRWFVGVERLSELPRGESTSRLLMLFVLFGGLVWVPVIIDQYEGLPYALYLPYGRVAEFALGLVTAALFLSIRQRQYEQQQQQLQDIEQAQSAVQPNERTLIDRLASTPLLNSPIVLDVVITLTIVLVILLALPTVQHPRWLTVGSWLAVVLCYIILTLALTSQPSSGGRQGMFGWLLTRPVVLELGAMSFCFYAFHLVPIVYAKSIGIAPNRSVAIEFCAAVGLAWIGYKYVETPVYNMLSARLPSCRCHKT